MGCRLKLEIPVHSQLGRPHPRAAETARRDPSRLGKELPSSCPSYGRQVSVVAGTRRRQWFAVLSVVLIISFTPLALSVWPVDAGDIAVESLRDKVLASANVPYEGFAQSQGNAGVPELPALSQVGNLFNGTIRLRAWYAAPDHWRVDQIDSTGELGYYRTDGGTEVWDFSSNELTRVIGDLPVRLPWAADLTPPALTRRLLAFTTPQDRLETLPDSRIAGVSAVGFRVVPRDDDSLVRHLDVWADPGSGLPLRVSMATRTGSTPVVVSRFLEVRQHKPDDDVLRPPAPAKASISATTEPDVVAAINSRVNLPLPPRLAGRERRATASPLSGVATYGTGWSSFVVMGAPGRLGRALSEALRSGGGQPVEVDEGQGTQLTGSLMTVVVVRADRGSRGDAYLLAGPVTAELLEQAAGDLLGATGNDP